MFSGRARFKSPNLLIAGFFALVILIVFKTFQDYGVTWDEEYHQLYGDSILSWYGSFFKDRSVLDFPAFSMSGGFFDTLAQLAGRKLPFGVYETRHLLGALFGLWTIFMSFRIAEHLSGYLAGFLTVLFLTLHPVFYGHMFNNPVDIPFGALLLTTLYLILKSYDDLPRIPLKNLLQIGIALGLMLGERIGGVLIVLPCILVCWSLWFPQNRKPFGAGAKDMLRNFGWIFAVAWPAMLMWCPLAQINPLINPLRAAFKAAHHDFLGNMTFFYEGNYLIASDLPKSYNVKLILLTLPEFFLIALFLGVVDLIRHAIKLPKLTAKSAKTGTLIFACLFPIATASLLTVQFDGYRHILFSIPLLAVLGGVSVTAFLHSKAARWAKLFLSSVLIISMGLTALDMYRLHPYQTVYFNRLLAGGLAKAAKNYDTDYWGNSYREGILWLIQNYNWPPDKKIKILNASKAFQTGYYLEKSPELRNRFDMFDNDTDRNPDPDIFLSTTRWNCYKAFRGKILYQVERDKTPLLYVIEVSENTRMTPVPTC